MPDFSEISCFSDSAIQGVRPAGERDSSVALGSLRMTWGKEGQPLRSVTLSSSKRFRKPFDRLKVMGLASPRRRKERDSSVA